MRVRHMLLAGCTGLLAMIAACNVDDGADAPPQVPGFSERDSAGVQLSVNQSTNAMAPLGWELAATPTLILGDEAETEFHRIRGVRQLPDGGIVVVDGGSREARFFDAGGDPLHRVGGRGSGPGEFEDPVLVPTPKSDSLLVFDGRLRRFHQISAVDRGFRTISRPRWPSALPPPGALGEHVLAVNVVNPVLTEMSEGPTYTSVTFRWIDLGADQEMALAGYDVPRWFLLESEPGFAPGAWAIPFHNLRPPAAVTPTGAVISEHGPELLQFGIDGSLQRVVRVEGFERPVTAEVIRAMAEIRAARTPDSAAEAIEMYGKMPLPESLPAFSSLRVDDLGWLWAELYEFEPDLPSARWMVFDPDGRAHGIIRMPRGFDPHHIREHLILGVWRTELGVEQVHLLPLRRQMAETRESR